MSQPDPLCPIELHDLDYCDLCRRLRTARLQGPVTPPHHAAVCWCEACMGTAVGPT